MGWYIVCVLIGLFIGLVVGLFLYSKFFDKPEIQHNYNDKLRIKQKKGIFTNWFHRK